MKNMKISLKLITSFTFVVILSLIIGIFGIYGLTSMSNAANSMYSKSALPLGDLAIGMDYYQRLRVEVRNAIIYTGNDEKLKTVENDMNDRIGRFEAAMSSYEPSISSEKGRELYSAVMNNYNKIFKPGILNVLNGTKTGKTQDILLEEMEATTIAANQIAIDLADLINARMNVMGSDNDKNAQLGNLLLIVIIAIIIVVAVLSMFLATYIARLISNPMKTLTAFMVKAGTRGDISLSIEDVNLIKELSQAKDEVGQCINSTANFINHLNVISEKLKMVSEGDLTAEIKLLSEDDIMGLSLKRTIDNLNEMFEEINSAAEQVTTSSKQISDGSQSLAQGSTEQAATVQELSSSIAQIAMKTKNNADMSERAADLADTIKQNAEKGNNQMSEMMVAVKEINEASQNISKVIKVIDDIAFQTNILALNAAVEAARAGQHGKGFAVVAEEVRNLAAKSADAAKDTSGLITNSIEKAEMGARIARETASSLGDIVVGINESAQIFGEIAKSSDEQSEGISQINNGIDQVAVAIQRSSATAEESAAASEEMNGLSIMLEKLISQFKVKK